jgi:hypothetical protein
MQTPVASNYIITFAGLPLSKNSLNTPKLLQYQQLWSRRELHSKNMALNYQKFELCFP